MPLVGVIGVAGEVKNNMVKVTNVAHWPRVDGEAIAARCGLKSFTIINDFAAAA